MASSFLSRRCVIAGGLASVMVSPASHAEEWPTRNIAILVGFGAGGVTDVATRLLAESLRQSLPKPIVIENRTGATGMIAATQVARAAPDGHTLLGMTASLTIAPSVMKNLSIDILRDLQPISIFATSPSLLVVGPDFPARSVKEFVELIKSKPTGEFAYATSGVGTTVHLMAGMIERSAGVRMRHVPYRSSSDSIQAVMAGDLPMVFSAVNSALPYIQAGSVRALAVATEKRTSFLPDVPTFDEAGLAGIRSDTWFGLAGPARMPRPLVDRIAVLCEKAGRDSAVIAKLAALGAEPVGLGPDEARTQMEREVRIFAELAASMGLGRDVQ